MILFHEQIRKLREAYGHHVLRAMRIFMPVACLGLFLYFGPSCWEAWQSRTYAETEGRILTITVRKAERFRDIIIYTFNVPYEYTVAGVTHRSDRFDPFGDLEVRAPAEAPDPTLQFVSRTYHDGAAIPVWYDPKSPDHALLVRGTDPIKARQDDLIVVPAAFVMTIVLWCIPLRVPGRKNPFQEADRD